MTSLDQMPPPTNPWMMETGSIIFWCVLAAISIGWTIRTRRLALLPLFLIAATSAFWIEFYGDWGAYLGWNPAFARLPFWGVTPFTTPVKPLFIPFSWGWWFAFSLTPLTMLVRVLLRRWPNASPLLLAMLTAFPLYCGYQLMVEGAAVSNGYWTYEALIGPVMAGEKGNLPIVFPILLGAWAAGMIALVARTDAQGLFWHDRWLGVDRIAPGFTRELARAGALTLVFQVTFFVVNTLPVLIGRPLFGGPSLLVP